MFGTDKLHVTGWRTPPAEPDTDVECVWCKRSVIAYAGMFNDVSEVVCESCAADYEREQETRGDFDYCPEDDE